MRIRPKTPRQWGIWPRRGAGRHLVIESESFLTGRWAVELHAGGRPVPGWAWISGLAHAPVDVVAGWAAHREPPPADGGVPDRWRVALSLVARELIVSAAAAGDSVETAQHLVFGRLEQRGVTAGDPQHLVRVGLRELAQYRQVAQARVSRPPTA